MPQKSRTVVRCDVKVGSDILKRKSSGTVYGGDNGLFSGGKAP
jgi:hypothetical protein